MSVSEHTFRDRDGQEFDVPAVEETLSRIPSVTAARVVLGDAGRVSEVHILASRERSPKQLVRDVQSVALASFGIEVDYRTVSVVQLEDALLDVKETPTGEARMALQRLSADVSGPAVDVRVVLDATQGELIGTARGPASSALKIVARAVVEAVAPKLTDAAVEVEFAETLLAGQHTIAVAVLKLATAKGDHAVSGSAIVRKDVNDAMARAALGALNRLLARL